MAIGDLILGIGLSTAAFRTLKRFFTPAEDDDTDTEAQRPLGNHSQFSARRGLPKSPMKATKKEVYSLEERIKYIKELIAEGREDPDVREFVVKIVSQKCGNSWCTPEKDNDAEIIAVFDAVRAKIRYVRDPISADTYAAAKHSLRLGGSDCDDFSVVLGSALGAIGYPTKLRVIWSKGSDDWNHIYLLVGLPPEHPDKWVPLDASMDRPAGWEVPESEVVRFKDFEVD